MPAMKSGQPTEISPEDQRSLLKLRELSRGRELPAFSIDRLLARVPDDWAEGEDDVDEFLGSIRLGRTRR